MNFWKKVFGGGPDKKHDAEQASKNEAHPPHERKEEHDKDHNGENKKPKNVCEFC